MSKEGPTPAMRQFYEMKKKYPDTVLFFQMGDFYETFGEDAEVVSRELEITLTSRGRDVNGEKMPLAGVPIHAGEMYIARLVRKGYRVAICDQVEDPKKAKGIVKRDVVRIITPGTIIDSEMLGNSGSSYLMSVFPDKKNKEYGIAFLDISTGEFFISSCNASSGFSDLNSEISKYQPAECIIPVSSSSGLSENLKKLGVIVTSYSDSAFDLKFAGDYLKNHFHVSSLEGYGCLGMDSSICAAGACLSYACETQMTDLNYIRNFSTKISSNNMILDAVTLRNLEILENIKSGGPDSSLFGILNETKTPMGSRILKKFITSPLVSKAEIDRRLDSVGYFYDLPMIRSSLREHLHKFYDIERIASRISYGNAGPRDLNALKDSLEKITDIKSDFDSSPSEIPYLVTESLRKISDMEDIRKLIAKAVCDEPPVNARVGGVIREGYALSLDELRDISVSGKDWIASFQQSERERTGIKSLKVGYNKVFGYFIEVTKSNSKNVPPEYVRKQTTVNGERYTLPVLQEKESLIANAEEKVSALEYEIYQELIEKIKPYVETIQTTARNIGLLDVYANLAAISHSRNYIRPVIEDSKRLLINNGRHPVVERNIQNFVPNDADLDSSDNQILIITGANMAGKSTYMREVALICIMAQTGCFVPADTAVIGIVDRIFTRVGAFDDLASGQSTFMVEMLELANILNNVTPESLVILDEIGRGTSTLDGFSIAKAVLEFLHGTKQEGPRTLFATHFHEMVEIEADLKRVRNYHFAVRETGDDVVFLRKLIPGATDRSYGIHVAKLAGIPSKVIKRSEIILKEEQEKQYDPKSGRKMPRYTQLLLIDNPEPVSSPRKEDPVLKKLKSIDPNSVNPREALALLYELKKEAGDDNN
ncbi:DNA mismatch repair protein MutS [Methanomicrobium sp. W14]|uniref:DNA mismatch repair protein MutS n=1 Tax=Methanomicrobium sp. W14 TaxID=2817839 RepID=UPI001AEAE552|nr:DNA mismatch repair protein MutS [Methanomicrobium sp. W14]MBP2132878.1 DNA mismatch repair protein MutS [Methanomicrobium sp. W14]